jgi:hypothetical protein
MFVADSDGCMVVPCDEKRAGWEEAGVARVSIYETRRQGPER